MFNKLFQSFRTSSTISRLKVEGPLNTKSQMQITERINRIQQLRSDALLVVINSFGGSLQSAKNISARLKKLSLNNQIPVYCFAEEFCLNSANLILTTGTKSFAHKFSVIGDFGYVYEGIDTTELQQTFGIREHHISTMKNQHKTNILNSSITPNSKQFIQKLLNQQQESLKQQILINRNHSLTKMQHQSFLQFLESNEGFLNLQKSIEGGLIDGIVGIQEWIIYNCKGKRIIEGTGQQFDNPMIEWIRSAKDSFRFKEQ